MVPGSAKCRMLDLLDLRTGERARITQDRGSESRGCKLDEQALLSMAHCIESAIRDAVDLVVISRFGRAEAAGHGLLASCADVVCAGTPAPDSGAGALRGTLAPVSRRLGS